MGEPHHHLNNKALPANIISGTLERITYQNDENGYTVARFKILKERGPQQKSLVTVVGVLSGLPVGSTLQLSGDWVEDSRYGRQFKVSKYTLIKPNTLNGIERYLGSGLIKGVGAKYAERIVAKFGLKTIDILDSNPDRLREVQGLGAKRIEQIKTAWAEHKDIHEVMVFLQSFNVSASYAVKIYKVYGKKSLTVVNTNPYRLAEDIWGIGFRIADDIAQSLGVPGNDPRRARAGILFVLNEAAGDGHCYLFKEDLVIKVSKLLWHEENSPSFLSQMIEVQLSDLVSEKKISAEGDKVFLSLIINAEKGVASKLQEICGGIPLSAIHQSLNNNLLVARAGKAMGLALAPEQEEAIKCAINNKVTVITGGPGTGKSTVLKGFTSILEEHNVPFALAAPTGRAAKRLHETTGHPAKTIHRLLEFDPSIMGFKKNSSNPLKVEYIIIDEVSMMDILLMSSLLKSIQSSASLLLVGDADQLPSVGAGNVLRDIIESECVPVIHLQQIFRQGPGSLISINASLINKGKSLELLPDFKGDKDFFCIFREGADSIEKEVVSLCNGRLEKKYGFDPIRDIQVLTPMRKGVIGADSLNLRLQEVLIPTDVASHDFPSKFRTGDKVMQIRNNYEKEVFNGDLGVVKQQKRKEQIIQVDYDGRIVVYEASDLNELALAYAITVHKSQGSEFPSVIIPIHTIHYPLLQKNLLYTAVTRGKKIVVLVGSRKAISIAIKNDRTHRRQTALKERLNKKVRA